MTVRRFQFMWWLGHVQAASRHTHQKEPTINSLRPRRNRRHFADDPFKRIFLNETLRISIKISLNFVPKGPINNIPALVQIMASRLRGDKPLSGPMSVRLLMHICVTRPQWVKPLHVIVPAWLTDHVCSLSGWVTGSRDSPVWWRSRWDVCTDPAPGALLGRRRRKTHRYPTDAKL